MTDERKFAIAIPAELGPALTAFLAAQEKDPNVSASGFFTPEEAELIADAIDNATLVN